MLISKLSDTNLVVCVLVCFQHSILDLRYELSVYSLQLSKSSSRTGAQLCWSGYMCARALGLSNEKPRADLNIV